MKTALIIIDIQNDYFDKGSMPLVGSDNARNNAKLILERFRTDSLPIIHIQHIETRPTAAFFLPNTKGAEIHDNVKPTGQEKVIVKHYPNSFRETELLDYLKSKNITDLVICGMMTHMCIDATVRAAKDYGFNIILIGDACATKDQEINGQIVKAEEVQKSFLAALNYFYTTVKTTSNYLNVNKTSTYITRNNMKKKIYVFLFNGFSDWEISYLTPEINKSEQFELVYFSKNGNPITSMGGLQITPTTSLNELKFEDVDMLILPGGTAWEKGENNKIEELTINVFEKGKPIAAICAATTYIGQLGLLNNLKHTSNDLNYLKGIAPKYCGDENYQNSLTVTDRNIITANGIAPIEFAREIFKTIGLYTDDNIEKWFQLFKNGIWSE